MATTPPEQSIGDATIPRWFHEFALANAAQHAQLADRIAQVEKHVVQVEHQLDQQMAQLESRIIRWVVGSAIAVVGVVATVAAATAAAWAVWGPM